jgi:hypothetical protein
MELKCPNCGQALPDKAKFCNECGHNLGKPLQPPPKDLSFDEKIDKIKRYLPKGLTEKILSQRDKIEGERKQVDKILQQPGLYSQCDIITVDIHRRFHFGQER